MDAKRLIASVRSPLTLAVSAAGGATFLLSGLWWVLPLTACAAAIVSATQYRSELEGEELRGPYASWERALLSQVAPRWNPRSPARSPRSSAWRTCRARPYARAARGSRSASATSSLPLTRWRRRWPRSRTRGSDGRGSQQQASGCASVSARALAPLGPIGPGIERREDDRDHDPGRPLVTAAAESGRPRLAGPHGAGEP